MGRFDCFAPTSWDTTGAGSPLATLHTSIASRLWKELPSRFRQTNMLSCRERGNLNTAQSWVTSSRQASEIAIERRQGRLSDYEMRLLRPLESLVSLPSAQYTGSREHQFTPARGTAGPIVPVVGAEAICRRLVTGSRREVETVTAEERREVIWGSLAGGAASLFSVVFNHDPCGTRSCAQAQSRRGQLPPSAAGTNCQEGGSGAICPNNGKAQTTPVPDRVSFPGGPASSTAVQPWDQ